MMHIIMLKPTHFRMKFYSRGNPYTVEEVQGNRWIKRKLAVLDTREEMVVKLPAQEGFKNEIPEVEEIKVAMVPEFVEPENNGMPNIKELKLMAKAAKIPGYSRMNKKELMGALNGDNDAC